MTELKTETFSIRVPNRLDQHRVIWETVRAESSQVQYEMQNPELNVGLAEIACYDTNPGESFEERFCNNLFEAYDEAKLVERLEVDVAGRPSVVQVGRVSWEWDGKKADVLYLSAALKVDDLYHYEMKAFCEQDQWETFRPLFLEVWSSLTSFGDRKAALQKQTEAIDAIHNRHNPPEPARPDIKVFTAPEDGQDVFRADRTHLDLSLDSQIEISESERTLSVDLRASVPAESVGRSELFDENALQRGVRFRFRFSGVHRNGVPTVLFTFKYGESEDRSADLWHDGWGYALRFSGEVVLRDGWFGMNGYLGKPWDPEPYFEVELYKKFDPAALDWSHYRFSSLEETSHLDPRRIRFLTLTKPDFEELPAEVLRLSELRELTIVNSSSYVPEPRKLPLSSLPDDIASLKNLTSLHISGARLEHLPESLGELESLQNLCVAHCCLQTTPDSVWQLPSLKNLNFSNNQLRDIPAEICLPDLSSLYLNRNDLETLPAVLATQKSLQKLVLNDNPLQYLPDGYEQIRDLELSMEDKLRLLDFTYQGADGQGTLIWDEEAYLAKSSPVLRPQLSQHRLADALLSAAKLTLVFEHGDDEDYTLVGNTRFGGWPDLPLSVPYPRFGENEMAGKRDYLFEFLAQINCEEAAPLQDYLPRTGILYFFLDTVHQMTPKVIYWNGESSDLVSGATLAFGEDDFYEFADPPYAGFKSEPVVRISLPQSYSSHVNTHFFQGPAKALIDSEELVAQIETELGLEDHQGDHEVNSYVFTQHEGPELQAALQKKGLPEDWVVLLKVASAGDFQWWDSGELFFVIHKSDLAKSDFSGVYCGLESS
jgi:uncharacterized protein YwqG